MKASFLGDFGLGLTRAATRNSESSSDSARDLRWRRRDGGGGGEVVVLLLIFCGFLNVGNGLVALVRLVVVLMGIGMVRPPQLVVVMGRGMVVVAPPFVVVVGVMMVKTIARGKQRRRAQKRDTGVGDSMVLFLVFSFQVSTV